MTWHNLNGTICRSSGHCEQNHPSSFSNMCCYTTKLIHHTKLMQHKISHVLDRMYIEHQRRQWRCWIARLIVFACARCVGLHLQYLLGRVSLVVSQAFIECEGSEKEWKKFWIFLACLRIRAMQVAAEIYSEQLLLLGFNRSKFFVCVLVFDLNTVGSIA